jgi:hypothetical protein
MSDLRLWSMNDAAQLLIDDNLVPASRDGDEVTANSPRGAFLYLKNRLKRTRTISADGDPAACGTLSIPPNTKMMLGPFGAHEPGETPLVIRFTYSRSRGLQILAFTPAAGEDRAVILGRLTTR